MFSIDYTVLASVSTAQPVSGFEFATGGYEVLMEATDADAYSAAYTTAKNNGATDDEADEAGFAAGDLEFYEFRDDDLLTCINTCIDSTSLQRDMALTFDVEAGTTYAFGAEGGVYVYTQVNAVPLPAAAWLFGSGLIGLLGVARKQCKLRQS
ncbi:VPLPA-CTERM sorting domain-containing protein [Halieaceae bacterium IMCC14734]|uniref:VPLPA-CTERM sorting domain-containing protein n=2 Tax=Candidatus Litorirhabdus singularis TaxID=2518993 RepID=A0ABT3TFL6_9GAMM|nr:VPLPA-CTERM sorting domain-containing protein [Candidatus Litorirhabdus singularis]